MVKHIVLFKLKDTSEESCLEAAKILESMRENINYIRELEVGRDFLHSPRSFDIYLSVVVDNADALAEYQDDAYHCDVVKAYMKDAAEKTVCIDFEF